MTKDEKDLAFLIKEARKKAFEEAIHACFVVAEKSTIKTPRECALSIDKLLKAEEP